MLYHQCPDLDFSCGLVTLRVLVKYTPQICVDVIGHQGPKIIFVNKKKSLFVLTVVSGDIWTNVARNDVGSSCEASSNLTLYPCSLAIDGLLTYSSCWEAEPPYVGAWIKARENEYACAANSFIIGIILDFKGFLNECHYSVVSLYEK